MRVTHDISIAVLLCKPCQEVIQVNEGSRSFFRRPWVWWWVLWSYCEGHIAWRFATWKCRNLSKLSSFTGRIYQCSFLLLQLDLISVDSRESNFISFFVSERDAHAHSCSPYRAAGSHHDRCENPYIYVAVFFCVRVFHELSSCPYWPPFRLVTWCADGSHTTKWALGPRKTERCVDKLLKNKVSIFLKFYLKIIMIIAK